MEVEKKVPDAKEMESQLLELLSSSLQADNLMEGLATDAPQKQLDDRLSRTVKGISQRIHSQGMQRDYKGELQQVTNSTHSPTLSIETLFHLTFYSSSSYSAS